MSTSTSRVAGTQAVRRAILLLRSFTDSHPERHPTELAEANSLNVSTAYHILRTLEREGLVVRPPYNRRYRLGPELIALGGSALRSNSLRTVARPIIQNPGEETGESTTLEVLARNQVIVFDEVAGAHVVTMSQDIGARLPAHQHRRAKHLRRARCV
jgi:DNA-binding IclR family transcriptional regulator